MVPKAIFLNEGDGSDPSKGGGDGGGCEGSGGCPQYEPPCKLGDIPIPPSCNTVTQAVFGSLVKPE